jgi:hypothetical protein
MLRSAKTLLAVGMLFLLTLTSSHARSDEQTLDQGQRGASVAAARAAEAIKKPDVRVALAVPEGAGTIKSPLHMIIENVGDKPHPEGDLSMRN